MLISYIAFSINASLPYARPGFDGDAMLSWTIDSTENYSHACSKSIDAMYMLQSFWIQNAVEYDIFGYSFDAFFNLVCRPRLEHFEHLQQHPDANAFLALNIVSENKTTANLTSNVMHEANSEAVAHNNQDSTTVPSISDRLNIPVTEVDISSFAKFLVDHADQLPLFLTDVRDWDAFRLLMLRHKINTIEFQSERLETIIRDQKLTIASLSQRISQLEFYHGRERKALLDAVWASHLKTQSLMELLKESVREYPASPTLPSDDRFSQLPTNASIPPVPHTGEDFVLTNSSNGVSQVLDSMQGLNIYTMPHLQSDTASYNTNSSSAGMHSNTPSNGSDTNPTQPTTTLAAYVNGTKTSKKKVRFENGTTQQPLVQDHANPQRTSTSSSNQKSSLVAPDPQKSKQTLVESNTNVQQQQESLKNDAAKSSKPTMPKSANKQPYSDYQAFSAASSIMTSPNMSLQNVMSAGSATSIRSEHSEPYSNTNENEPPMIPLGIESLNLPIHGPSANLNVNSRRSKGSDDSDRMNILRKSSDLLKKLTS